MSYEDEEEDFNQRHIVMKVKVVPKRYSSFTYVNELYKLIDSMEWKKIKERITQKHKVRTLSNNNNESRDEDLPLEIECPMRDGDLPLFKCLRNEHVPFELIKIMTGKFIYALINRQLFIKKISY